MLTNISARYLGLRLNSPIVIGSSPMTLSEEKVRELAIAGAGAIVLPSLFEEQIVRYLLELGEATREPETLLESLTYEPRDDDFNGGPENYLDSIRRLKKVSALPVIASLNGSTNGSWLTFVARIQEAGADAVEFTFESATLDPAISADKVEQRLIDCVSDLCDLTSIPIAIKLSPFHTNLPNLAWRLIEAGASGFICFAHDTNWRISTASIGASLKWSLTPTSNINQTISGLLRVRSGGPHISVAASGGLSSVEDIIKSVLAGADVAMLTSEIYRSGISVVAHLIEGIAGYLDRHNYKSFDDLVLSRPTPKWFLRSDYLNYLTNPDRAGSPALETRRLHGDRWGHVV